MRAPTKTVSIKPRPIQTLDTTTPEPTHTRSGSPCVGKVLPSKSAASWSRMRGSSWSRNPPQKVLPLATALAEGARRAVRRTEERNERLDQSSQVSAMSRASGTEVPVDPISGHRACRLLAPPRGLGPVQAARVSCRSCCDRCRCGQGKRPARGAPGVEQ